MKKWPNGYNLGLSMGRVGFGLGNIILLFFLIRSESDSIKFGSKNLELYPT
jgi:hypothetical protein